MSLDSRHDRRSIKERFNDIVSFILKLSARKSFKLSEFRTEVGRALVRTYEYVIPASASWPARTRTVVVSPFGAYASVTAVRVRGDQRLGVVVFCMVEASSEGEGGLATTLGPIVGLEREQLGNLNGRLRL